MLQRVLVLTCFFSGAQVTGQTTVLFEQAPSIGIEYLKPMANLTATSRHHCGASCARIIGPNQCSAFHWEVPINLCTCGIKLAYASKQNGSSNIYVNRLCLQQSSPGTIKNPNWKAAELKLHFPPLSLWFPSHQWWRKFEFGKVGSFWAAPLEPCGWNCLKLSGSRPYESHPKTTCPPEVRRWKYPCLWGLNNGMWKIWRNEQGMGCRYLLVCRQTDFPTCSA